MQRTDNTPVTVAYGDGIGHEITEATLEILRAAGARLDIREIEVGAKAYHQGHSSGISPKPGNASALRKFF